MNASWRWAAAFVLLFGLLTPAANSASSTNTSKTSAQSAAATQAASASGSAFLEPEIVRLAYVQGDVRLAPPGGKTAIGQNWVQAEPGIPLEQGSAINTGTGRAEIELEDNSVIYLADNSTLLFESLLSLNGVPRTTLQLVSGTATIDAHPLPGGDLVMETPSTNHISVTYPQSAVLRIDSYVDGVIVTPQQATSTKDERGPQVQLRAGQSVTYALGAVHVSDASKVEPPDQWDQWVKSQMIARQKDMQAALKASGLTHPVPGLIDLYKTGTFTPCAPYGTCWRPNPPVASPAPGSVQAPLGARQTPPQNSATPQLKLNRISARRTPKRLMRPFRYSLDPCVTAEGYEIWDPQKRKWVVIQRTVTSYQYWDWETCRAGTWIHRGRRHQGHDTFVLVLRKRKRHHHHRRHRRPVCWPVCWVRVGNKIGFVPVDPRDKRGRTPVNLKYGLFVPGAKPGEPAKLVEVGSAKHVKILDGPPRNFSQISAVLAPAQQPVIESRALNDNIAPAKVPVVTASAKSENIPIIYNYKKSSFVSSGALSHGKSGVVVRLHRVAIPMRWPVRSGYRITNVRAGGAVSRAPVAGSSSRTVTVVRSSGGGYTRSHGHNGGGRGYSGGGGGYSGGGGRDSGMRSSNGGGQVYSGRSSGGGGGYSGDRRHGWGGSGGGAASGGGGAAGRK